MKIKAPITKRVKKQTRRFNGGHFTVWAGTGFVKEVTDSFGNSQQRFLLKKAVVLKDCYVEMQIVTQQQQLLSTADDLFSLLYCMKMEGKS